MYFQLDHFLHTVAVENGSRARWIGRSESRKRRVKTRSKQANQAKARLFNDNFLGENTISYTPHQFWRRGVYSQLSTYFSTEKPHGNQMRQGETKKRRDYLSSTFTKAIDDWWGTFNWRTENEFFKCSFTRVFTDFVTFYWLNGEERDAEAKATH